MVPCILGLDAVEKHEFIIDGKEKTVYRLEFDSEQEKEEFILTNPFELTIPPYQMINCELAVVKRKGKQQ